MAESDVSLSIILLAAFLPSLFYMIRIRNSERYSRNPWILMLLAFIWGAVAAVILALALSVTLDVRLSSLRPAGVPNELFLAVIVAPLAEEPAKALGVVFLGLKRRWEEEDGLVYGAAAGLGFAATENLLYEYGALLTAGFLAWVVTVFARSLTSTLLHGSSSAVAGWGVSKWRAGGAVGGFGAFLLFMLLAMLMHGLFNLLSSVTLGPAGGEYGDLVLLLFVFIYAGAIWGYTKRKVTELDARGAARQTHL